MSNLRSKYKDILTIDVSLSISSILREAMSLYGKTIGWFLLFGIVFFIVYLGTFLVSFLFMFIPVVGSVIVFSLFVTLILGAVSGVYYFTGQVYKGNTSFKHFFQGYKYIGQLFLCFVFIGIIAIVVLGIPLYFLISENTQNLGYDINTTSFVSLDENASILTWICFTLYTIGNFLVGMAFVFSADLIVNSNMNAWEAIQLGPMMILKNIGKILSLFFLFTSLYIILFSPILFFGISSLQNTNIISQGGLFTVYVIIAYLITLFFVIPYMFTTFHVVYQHLFQKNILSTQEQQLASFGVSETDVNRE